MVDASDVRRLAMALPDTVEDASGTSFSVGGTGFAWPWRERVHLKRAKIERRDILVVRVAHEDDKQAHLTGEPEKYFTEAHYDGYPAILVRLDAIHACELAEILTDAHHAARQRQRRPRRARTSR